MKNSRFKEICTNSVIIFLLLLLVYLLNITGTHIFYYTKTGGWGVGTEMVFGFPRKCSAVLFDFLACCISIFVLIGLFFRSKRCWIVLNVLLFVSIFSIMFYEIMAVSVFIGYFDKFLFLISLGLIFSFVFFQHREIRALFHANELNFRKIIGKIFLGSLFIFTLWLMAYW